MVIHALSWGMMESHIQDDAGMYLLDLFIVPIYGKVAHIMKVSYDTT